MSWISRGDFNFSTCYPSPPPYSRVSVSSSSRLALTADTSPRLAATIALTCTYLLFVVPLSPPSFLCCFALPIVFPSTRRQSLVSLIADSLWGLGLPLSLGGYNLARSSTCSSSRQSTPSSPRFFPISLTLDSCLVPCGTDALVLV
ncbi:hypothetical protein ASPVEDRAFT_218388 [Aspergillus versicolor CBS 583.65]|uniref:Uncharacterized protein n=1 Tax=Aspergillus versicolor CBS 583.65 TaxID=1036611 RepID=A0A1L9P3I6_ASPVE|nr:uncharacterized protein ASPVEDRAFT_218388 [Aspergillus versicolor CBS 583.65]OJI96097.1 hypothetical protein ASPVEDRAFT_218388 [Aspergillus versicolor CBS 583.65]